jgi:hypothetical protein
MLKNEKKFSRILALENEIHSQLVAAALEQAEIPFRIRCYKDSVYDGLFELQRGWGDLFAPAELEADILEILRREDLLGS